MKNNGCSYGKVSRQMILDMKSDVQEIKKVCEEVRNHYSNRLPAWATGIIAFLMGLIGWLIGLKI